MKLEFEWHDAKAEANWTVTHGRLPKPTSSE